jgi:DNA-directed RNA polymerase I, II, and III subunit RPABC1
MSSDKIQSALLHVLEMLADRGINTSDLIANIPTSIPSNGFEVNGRLRIFYMQTRVVKDHLKNPGQGQSTDAIKHHIIIAGGEAPKLTTVETENGYTVEIFTLDELQYNPSKHMLVPRHELLSKDDADNVLTLYDTQRSQLPLIMKTDRMARHLGMRPGQIVRITSASPTAGEYVHYRYCV